MSLNWREIDAILEELHLEGAFIRKVSQPDFRNFLLLFHAPPSKDTTVRFVLEHPFVRIHGVTDPPRIRRTHQRFEDFLHSRIIGGKVVEAAQLYHDRIIRFVVHRHDETTQLYLRLWGTHSNFIVTDENDRILDVAFRKPKQGLVSGEAFRPGPPDKPAPARHLRPHPDDLPFQRWIEGDYTAQEEERTRRRLHERVEKLLLRRRGRLLSRIAEVERGSSPEGAEKFQLRGELILANIYRIPPGAETIDVEDYTDENRIRTISLDPRCTPQESAQKLFDRAKRIRETASYLKQSARSLDARKKETDRLISSYPTMEIPELQELERELTREQRRNPQGEQDETGLRFSSGGFQITVGRNARENDRLLRREMRGNDWWLHTRDHPGGYVFIKTSRGKSVPLDVLLDAGNLAVFFSKARENGKAELYYTQVKYLRRAKNGPTGLVLPTQEKNLSISIERNRLVRLGVLENSL